MSQSLGWLDNIIFSMAPLGILTAIVGAIRVGGPTWLKAVIGRAREDRATAEAELMSSTSSEVCELWDGGQIVRFIGSVPVQSLIYVPREDGGGDIYSLAEALRNGDLMEAKGPRKAATHGPPVGGASAVGAAGPQRLPDAESGGFRSGNKPSSEANKSTEGLPLNMTLNVNPPASNRELCCAAVVGVLLQFGVIVYWGFATYHPRLQFKKGGNSVQSYAFPLTAIGTVVLIISMLLCSHVIEGSTEETWYKTTDEKKRVQVFWIQKSQSASDQTIDSFAIFAKDWHRTLITSRRDKRPAAYFKTMATAGAILGLIGFILQFVGFRAMHWTAIISQLGATLLMSFIRAWVRRGLARGPEAWKLPAGHELDWVATSIVSSDSSALWGGTHETQISPRLWEKLYRGRSTFGVSKNPEKRSVDFERRENHLWQRNISTCGDASKYNALTTGSGKSPVQRQCPVLRDRVKIGEITGWTGPGAEMANSLSNALETVMDTLCIPARPSTVGSNAEWQLDVSCTEDISIIFEYDGTKWRVNDAQIEAALSLWLFAARTEETKLSRDELRKNGSTSGGASLRSNSKGPRMNLRLFGPITDSLRRDLRWWVSEAIIRAYEVHEEPNSVRPQAPDGSGRAESEEPTILQYRKVADFSRSHAGSSTGHGGIPDTPALMRFPRHRVVGFTHATNPKSSLFDEPRPPQTPPANQRKKEILLAAESEVSLEMLYAQEMFSSFMWATAKWLQRRIPGPVTHTSEAPDETASWQSFTLHSTIVTRVIQDVQRTGLGSLEDIYMNIIPPLSIQKRLPEIDLVVEIARQRAKGHEWLGHWEEAGEIYGSLFKELKGFDTNDTISPKATAALSEFFKLVTLTLRLRKKEHFKGNDMGKLKKVQTMIKGLLEQVDALTIIFISDLYEFQGRLDGYEDIVSDARHRLPKVAGQGGGCFSGKYNPRLQKFGFTKTHHAAYMGEFWRIAASGIYARDIFNWTPLHYSAVYQRDGEIGWLSKLRPKIDAKDSNEWTPLHYACLHGKYLLGWQLVQEGADVNSTGRDGTTPLHCGATCGCLETCLFLLSAGASTDAQDIMRRTPLHLAAAKGYNDVVGELINQGSRQNIRDVEGRTPTHMAAIGGCQMTLESLQRNNNVEDKDRTQRTALHYAALCNNEAMARLLIESFEADKEARDNGGSTPLHLAARSGNEAVVRLLMESPEADKEAKENSGYTPLHLATIGGHEAVVRLLVESFGAEKEARDNDHERMPLHFAAKSGSEALVRLLVESFGADKEAQDNDGRTPLHFAAESGSEAVVRLLIEPSGAGKEARDNNKRTPLHFAVESGNEAMVRLLIGSFGADKEVRDDGGQTLLHLAALSGNEAIVRLLIESFEADKDSRDKWDNTPLHLAAIGGHEAVVRLLMEPPEANKGARNHNGETPLHIAARRDRNAVVRLLIESFGADKEARDSDGWTPLHFAAESGSEAVVRLLIESFGADKEARDNRGYTPLHLAVELPGGAMVRLLIEPFGADKEASDNGGHTPLHIAAESGNGEVVRLLIESFGANKEARGNDGRTPLHFAAESGGEGVVQLLIESCGADKEARDGSGRAPLHVSAELGQEAVVRMLIESFGADKEARDNDGRTPLHSAAKSGCEDVVRLLIELFEADKEARDNSGQTPLHVGAEAGHEAVVQLLTESFGADKEARDDRGETPLHVATRRGHEAVGQLLG